MTIAKQVREANNPYSQAVAMMAWRDTSVPMKVIFHFPDGSKLAFTKAYTLDDEVSEWESQ